MSEQKITRRTCDQEVKSEAMTIFPDLQELTHFVKTIDGYTLFYVSVEDVERLLDELVRTQRALEAVVSRDTIIEFRWSPADEKMGYFVTQKAGKPIGSVKRYETRLEAALACVAEGKEND